CGQMDNGPKKNGSLPGPELNPMLNPTLGKNLGRWAQVYFTSPPEKREEAVQELLKELENGGNGDIAVQVSSPPAPSETKDDFAERDDMLLAGFNAVAPTRAEPEEQREFTPPKPAFEPPEVSYRQSKELFPDEVDN